MTKVEVIDKLINVLDNFSLSLWDKWRIYQAIKRNQINQVGKLVSQVSKGSKGAK